MLLKQMLVKEKVNCNLVDRTKNYQADLKLEQELHKFTKKQLEESNRQRERLTQQLKDREIQVEQIKNRSLIDRIFNKF